MKKRFVSILAALVVLTLLPIAGLAGSGIDIDTNPVFENGYAFVTWTDSNSAGPYTVGYMLYDDDGTTQRAFLANGTREASATQKTSYTLKTLIPGHTYIIGVIDKDGNETDEVITVPAASEFVDGKLKAQSVTVSTDPMYARSLNSSIQGLKRFVANDMIAHIEQYYYGLSYEIRLPKLAYDREYLVQIELTAPNGYSETIYSDPYVFGSGPRYKHSSKFLADGYFHRLYDTTGDIPVGTYTLRLFLNGMLANTKEFKVR